MSVVVACGTYDGTVFALNYEHETLNRDGPRTLKPQLVDPAAHTGSVGALAVSGDVIVSGSSDEIIQLFSVRSKARLGALELHVGTVRHLEFAHEQPGSPYSHLFSTGDDGCIAIWRRDMTQDKSIKLAYPSVWECIRQLRRHKGPVQSFSIHPSNCCAFSTSEDKTLRVWNLLRGRQAYAVRLKNIAEGAQTVAVSPTGRCMLLAWPTRFDVVRLLCPSAGADQQALCLGSVQFAQTSSASPVFFHEDELTDQGNQKDKYVLVLAGFGVSLNVFRFALDPDQTGGKGVSKPENLGEARLPGKRIKFIKVLSWPQSVICSDAFYQGRSKLVGVVTTEAEASHLRGYAINLDLGCGLEPGKSLIPVFTYDLSSARVTAFALGWQQLSDTRHETVEPSREGSDPMEQEEEEE